MADHRRPPLLDLLVGAPGTPDCDTPSRWLPEWRAAIDTWGRHGPHVTAIAAALRADRMAWALFSGNQGAKQAGFPGVLADGAARIAALMSS